MKLYGVHLSPYFMRNWLQLHLKGQADQVAYPGVPGGGLGTPEHLALNPMGRIPFAELADGTILPESQVITEYLERVFPEPSLRPADPVAASKIDLIGRILDLYILPDMIFLTRIVGRGATDKEKEHIDAVQEGVAYLEHFFASQDWAVGDSVTLADCMLLPFLFFVKMIEKGAGVDVLADRPKLSVYRINVADQDLGQLCVDKMQESLIAVRQARAAAEAEASS